MNSAGKKSKKAKGALLIGLLLVAAGIMLVMLPLGASVAEWLMRLWPIFLICAGVVRVMGYAIERKPRSPVGGMLLIVIGVLFFASRFHSDLNALQIYGRYWLVLLGVFAAVELVRYYSHRHTEGPPPRLFTPWRLIVIALIVFTGVIANRVAGDHPSLLSALRLPGWLGGLRDSIVGEKYPFTDPPFVATGVSSGIKIAVSNSYGNVKITGGASTLRATLSKGVRAWSEEDAREIAKQIRLVVKQTPDGFSITTNRDEVNNQFTTDIQIEVPELVALDIANSYGFVYSSGISGELSIKVDYGRAEIARIEGDVNLNLAYSDVDAQNVTGDLIIKGARRARVSKVSGAVDLVAVNGSVEVREVSGPVRVDAPFCRIVAQNLGETAELKTEHASVRVIKAKDVIIEAPLSDVRAENIDGDLRVSSSQGDIRLKSIQGQVVIAAERSLVNVENVQGHIEVDDSHRDISIKNFYDSVRVRTSYCDVTLVAAGQPSGDIEVENSHGQIKLVLPQSSEFQLDASSQNGQIKPVGFDGLAQRKRESLSLVFGSEGPTIKLRTSFKDIIIQASRNNQAQAAEAVN